MEDSFSQSDRLSRLRLELWQGAGGWWGYRLQGSVFQLGKVLEEAQTRKNDALVVLHLHKTHSIREKQGGKQHVQGHRQNSKGFVLGVLH